MNLHSDIHDIPFYGWVALGILLFSESLYVFRDAQKRGANPWIWGIWSLTNFPTPLIVYLIVVRKIFRKSRKKVQ